MKNLKLLLGLLLLGTMVSSCYVETGFEDDFIEDGFTVDDALHEYDLWYVDINETKGNGEVPFLQRAFTVSFDNGRIYANNNIVGIGKTGDGYGIQIASYNLINGGISVNHNLDGNWPLEVLVANNKTLEIYDRSSGTSYFLRGYNLNSFDFDLIFYENIQYFLQEYDAWEKTYTSEQGAINDFDAENFLQFFTEPNGDIFRSSIDESGTNTGNLQWDFEGAYQVFDVADDESLKTITLDYDYLGEDYFELYVINDSTVELYHPDSETVYEFKGRGYIQYLKSGKTSGDKKRIKSNNKIMKVKRQRVK